LSGRPGSRDARDTLTSGRSARSQDLDDAYDDDHDDGTARPRRPRRHPLRFLFWPGLLLLLLSLPFALARLDGGAGRFHPFEVRLAALTPIGGLLALAGLLLALLAGVRRPRAAVLALLAAVLLGLHVTWQVPVLRGAPTAVAADVPGVEVRVLALNAHSTGDPGQIVRTVRDEHVDVLALSESGEEHYRALQAAGLQQLLPYTSDHLRQGVDRVGLDSTVIRSRYPLTLLPEVPVSGYTLPRARITVPGTLPLTFVTVHLASPRPDTTADWQSDLARVQRLEKVLPEPSVLAGDFNSTHDHRAFRELIDGRFSDAAEVVGRDAWPGLTWPAGRRYGPAGRLDHVLVTRESLGVRSVRTVAIDGTDHRGVLAVLLVPKLG
jgi:endonuclease/exonuclease/phosphatase family metal-dependent hydrolase